MTNLVNDLSGLLQLVSQLQQENIQLHQKLQAKNVQSLQQMAKQIPQQELYALFKQLSGGSAHLDSVGIIQPLDGIYGENIFEKKQVCSACDILKARIRDLNQNNLKLQKNQDNMIMNFQRVLQKYNGQVQRQMKSIFKYGIYQNALAASIDIYNELVQAVQIKLNQFDFYENLNSLTSLSEQQLEIYHQFAENIIKNIEIECHNRVNSNNHNYSPLKESLANQISSIDIDWILNNYGKLMEDGQEVTERDMDKIIEQRISIEMIELNQTFFDGVNVVMQKEKFEESATTIRRQHSAQRPIRNKLENAKQNKKIETPQESFYPSNDGTQYTPYLGSHNFSNQRRSRAERLKSNSNSISR